MQYVFDKIRNYNYWDGRKFETGFIRSEYLNKIVKYIDNKLVKVLIGQRRTGKSYILRQIMFYLIDKKNIPVNNIFYFNKELIGTEDVKTVSDLNDLFQIYKDRIKPTGKIYIFIDEIQNIESWELFVNSYSQDFTHEYELFITGSNSKLLSGELATLLSGRYIEFQIFPFSFYEFAGYKDFSIDKESFIKYLKTGGLPEMLHFNEEDIINHYVRSLKDTIILRDIVERHKIKDISLLEDIFRFLMVNIGNMTSISGIVKYLKSCKRITNYETLSTYISYIRDAFIIHEVERYQLRSKQVLSGVRKYYLNDLAFKNYLTGFYPTDIGYNLENYVYLQLKRLGYNVRIGIINGKEIDFVAELSDKLLYVQVAYIIGDRKTAEREYGNLLSIKDNYEKVIISLDDVKFSDYRGIKHIMPWEIR